MSNIEEGQQSKTGNKRNREKNKSSVMFAQIKSLVEALTTGESQDLTSNLGKINFVITTERQYFTDPTMNDIIDGSFHVFGKAIRVIQEGDDQSINILRKAPLGQFKDVVPEVGQIFSQLAGLGLGGDTPAEIRGPAIQVMPIAIFA